jgi:hypothetical protein
MKEMVTLNRKEQRRLMVLNQVETGKMIGREAVEVLLTAKGFWSHQTCSRSFLAQTF